VDSHLLALVFGIYSGSWLLTPGSCNYGFPLSLSLLLPEALPPLLELLPELLPEFLVPVPLVPEPFVGGSLFTGGRRVPDPVVLVEPVPVLELSIFELSTFDWPVLLEPVPAVLPVPVPPLEDLMPP